MSRVVLSATLICLLVFSSGLTFHVHFCMNRVEGVSLFASREHQCSSCGMLQQESSGCCHQEKQLVKLVQDQCPPHFLHYNIAPAATFALPVQVATSVALVQRPHPVAGYSHGPPEQVGSLLYLRNRVFRI